jgi:hypothetical protein
VEEYWSATNELEFICYFDLIVREPIT